MSSTCLESMSVADFYNCILEKFTPFFYDILFKEIFNLCLVFDDKRPAMLLESANYNRYKSPEEPYQNATDFFREIIKETGIFRIVGDEHENTKYYIFKKEYFRDPSDSVIKEIRDDNDIGIILGFNCPGHMEGLWTISYLINGEIFYAEKCNNYDETIRNKQQHQSDSFKEVADKLGLEFEEIIKKKLSNNEIIRAIRESNVKIIIEHKDTIGSLYYDINQFSIGDRITSGILDETTLLNMRLHINHIESYLFSLAKRDPSGKRKRDASSFVERPPKKFKIHYTYLS